MFTVSHQVNKLNSLYVQTISESDFELELFCPNNQTEKYLPFEFLQHI